MSYIPAYKFIPPIKWSFLTPLYDFFCGIFGLGKKFKETVLESIPIKEKSTIADIGCGTGVLLEIAASKYPKAKLLGIDPDPISLLIAKRRIEKYGKRIILKKAFAESLPFDDNSIDVCFSTFAFHHMPDPIKRKAILEMHRVLKPGGWTVIVDFGETQSWLLRKILFFEKLEYIEGNFNGVIPQYLKKAGFKNIKVVERKYVLIDVLVAQKIST